MTQYMDDELLEDFLVEAGEILEQLQEQLVGLERDAQDRELLNAIFRGFHTIKGGAGFLQILPLVECCHAAENVFDLLRKGERQVTPELMDIVLQVLDGVVAMFAAVRQRADVRPAAPALLTQLAQFAKPAVEIPVVIAFAPVAIEKAAAEVSTSAAGTSDEITDADFEAMLDELHGKDGKIGAVTATPTVATSAAVSAASATDEVTDDEFESLLDGLHGKGATISGIGAADTVAKTLVESEMVAVPAGVASVSTKTISAVSAASLTTGVAVDMDAAGAHEGVAKQGAAKKGEAESTVRVDTRVLDELMNMVGELVLVRNRLVRLGLIQRDEELTKAVGNLDVVTADLQASVMKTRMQPIKKVFGRFPRVVRDLARTLRKEINLELVGEETDLDKNLVEALADPLVHLVRNSVDHGIELPAERLKVGKPRVGRVILAAEQEGDHIKLTISDDGKGMDPEVLRRKAVEKGMFEQEAADRLSDAECFELIFAPGFSTKEQISEVSGRGVGMDVVKTRISQLNGVISIQSQLGVGSRIVIKVPLTLAIMPTLMIMLGNQAFALPLANVVEIFNLDLGKTNLVDGKEIVVLRERPIPLYYLRSWLMPGSVVRRQGKAHVVIVNVGMQPVGFVVDQLIGQEEVVIKPLGLMLQGTTGLSGATITGDGRVALILDVPSMIQRYG